MVQVSRLFSLVMGLSWQKAHSFIMVPFKKIIIIVIRLSHEIIHTS